MNNYAVRSDQKELIDESDLPVEDWAVCLRELNIINTQLGGHATTVQGVKNLISSDSVSIAEIGCGGGDNLKAIYYWSKKQNLKLFYYGIDINEACIHFAKESCSDIPGIKFISSDYQQVYFDEPPDIIFNSLFCHHFSDCQIVEMLIWLKNNSRKGFFINDLQRHPFAYHSIKWLTKLFSKSYLIKNDAPISVLRGFRRREWERLLHDAGINNYFIQWRWAFRFLITVKNGE